MDEVSLMDLDWFTKTTLRLLCFDEKNGTEKPYQFILVSWTGENCRGKGTIFSSLLFTEIAFNKR